MPEARAVRVAERTITDVCKLTVKEARKFFTGLQLSAAQMKVADRSGARYGVLLAPEEAARQEVSVNDLRVKGAAQIQVPREQVVGWLRMRLEEGNGA